MFDKTKLYKFQIEGRIFYTGRVVEESKSIIKITTTRNENIILGIDKIIQVKELFNEGGNFDR